TSILNEFVELTPCVTPGNVSRGGMAALRDFRCNNDIVIKSADKGSAIVVWGKSDYIVEANKQLLDSSTYRKDDEDKIKQYNEDTCSFVFYGWTQGIINQETCESMIIKEPSPGRLHLLSKIHKDKTRCPRRPIVSGSGSCMEGISRHMDMCLKGIIAAVPAHLRDTFHF
uniref:Uncharacterized protein n=1 Tax=Latimeria chalumnae TaxID=7897 RepID=H3ALT3_LATCH